MLSSNTRLGRVIYTLFGPKPKREKAFFVPRQRDLKITVQELSNLTGLTPEQVVKDFGTPKQPVPESLD